MQILWWNMYPQSELDNYKLQVDLLQDKLKRSEENRQQLEQELKQILQKRSEHDKATRAKQRQKYQTFVDEQKRRNERNQLLLQMLERIDQQTTALTARSERLKMMKLQYERYFGKLMQTQPIRCIQDTSATTTTTPIPVLLPAAPATAAAPALCTSAPIKSNWHETATPTTTLPTANTMMQPTATPSLTPRMWTLAMATPTPAGLLLTAADAAAAAATLPATMTATPVVQSDYLASSGANSGYDYLPYPASCMPLMQQQQQLQQQIQQQLQQQLQQQQQQLYEQQKQLQQPTAPVTTIRSRDNALLPANCNVADTDPTTTQPSALQAFEKMQEAIAALANGEGDAARTCSNLAAPEYDSGIATMATTTTTLPSTPAAAPTTTAAVHKDNEQRPLSVINNATSATPVAAASALTFDKLPTTLTNVAAPSTAALPQLSEKNMANDSSEKGRTAEAEEKFQYLAKALDVVGPLTASVSESARYAVSGGNVAQLPPWKSPDRWQPEVQFKSDSVDSPNGLLGEGGIAFPGGLSSRFEEILTHTTANKVNDLAPLAAVAAASALGAQFNASAQLETKARQPTTAKMSIENIENAIYGELVNPPMEDDNKPQSYFADLMGQQQKPQEPHLIADAPQQNQLPTTAQQPEDYVNYAKTYADTTNASADDTGAISSVSESVSSYRPDEGSATYAPEYGTTSADVHTPTRQSDYASDANYAQYAPEGSDQQQSEPEQPQTDQPQQDYAQLDYGNYDATQYTNYDPNAYPGYTYNESTGEYTPDPQYEAAAADGYSEQQQQEYDEQQQQYETQQYADQQQQQQHQQQYDESQQQQQEEQEANYDYDGYAPQETTATAADGHVAAMVADLPAAAETAAAEAPTTAPNADSSDSNVPAPNATADTPKVLKPTSILASADKHAAANDAQKKKKRVNFVDSSETDDSSSAKPAAAGGKETGSESDFDFSNSGDAPAGN